MPKIALLAIITLIFLIPQVIFARTTPEDIINSQRLSYEQRVKNYSSLHRLKLDQLSNQIAQLNQDKTSYLEALVERQGEILDEYARRNNISEDGGKDGVHRNQDALSKTRLEVTRAHEAIAYQAARVYIINLTSESNIKNDVTNSISRLAGDLNTVRSQTINSQKLVEILINAK